MVKRDAAQMNNTECEAPPLKRSVSPSSDVEHSPLFGPSTSPEARDHAHHSELWGLPVKELKQRLKAVGSDVRGVTEKTELIILLEQLTEKSPSEGLLL